RAARALVVLRVGVASLSAGAREQDDRLYDSGWAAPAALVEEKAHQPRARRTGGAICDFRNWDGLGFHLVGTPPARDAGAGVRDWFRRANLNCESRDLVLPRKTGLA